MKVTKLRVADEAGLVPAGCYFKHLAAGLSAANTRETARRETLDAEDRRLEARYRRTSAARGGASTREEAHAVM